MTPSLGEGTTDVTLTGKMGDTTVTGEYPALSLSATTDVQGYTLGAEYAEGALTEVSVARDLNIGDTTVAADVTYKVTTKAARIKLMSGDVSATVDYTDGDVDVDEVSYTTDYEGKKVTATLSPKSSDLEIEIEDGSFEDDATWTATIGTNINDASNIIDGASVKLTRSWDF